MVQKAANLKTEKFARKTRNLSGKNKKNSEVQTKKE